MARSLGARARLALGFETVYGTPPASGFVRMPFAPGLTVAAEQPLLDSELLGYGRDPLAPVKDAITADGDVVVPIDAEAWGHWLKAAFGAPTTSGTGPYTHEFQSGAWDLPSFALEKGLPEVPHYAMYPGCRVNQLQWSMERSGLVTATVGVIAQGEDKSATSQAGTLTEPALRRFGSFNGSVQRDGAALGSPIEVIGTVEIRSAERNEKITRLERACVRTDAGELTVVADEAAVHRRGGVRQARVHVRPPARACRHSAAIAVSEKGCFSPFTSW
jgi:hypothetical protein